MNFWDDDTTVLYIEDEKDRVEIISGNFNHIWLIFRREVIG